ncbi:MAG: T9SS C-terminal target domain-containing protein [Sphingobacteriia bacterium]|nr:T9SS C-terminal target domain-containing protein [Candidatus Fonsibacter lacus]
MKKLTAIFICLLLNVTLIRAQSLYYPPLNGTTWDTMSPQSLNWCQPRIDSLYNYLQAKSTKSFIVLKNGKIVLEKYFGTYTSDSAWYWASAGKSLAGFITGVAQQKGFININTKVSQYIGNGWTSAPLFKENLITVKNLLQMTSGLDDSPPTPCDNEDTAKACLLYQVDAGTRWAYHTGAYIKTHDVVSAAASLPYNTITTNWIKSKIGMGGTWFQNVYYSKARDMARFGLLNLNKGIWNTDTIMKDSLYFKDMVNSSQNLNYAYGYLWWLNGKTSFMTTGFPIAFPGTLIPNAPTDMYAALGKNDQKIYVVPSQKLVIIRQGNTAGGFNLAASGFDNVLWDYINKLSCTSNSIQEIDLASSVSIYPNPAQDMIFIRSEVLLKSITLNNCLGQLVDVKVVNDKLDISQMQKGLYFLTITSSNNTSLVKKIVIN